MMEDDTGDGSMLCTDHPFKNNTPAGGICAFCLQEKLGKLVSSSFPIAVFPASSSSSSPSFRSAETTTNPTSLLPSNTTNPTTTTTTTTTTANNNDHYHYYSNRSRILYLLTSQKKKKSKDLNIIVDAHANANKNHLVFKRSKSTATPRARFMENDSDTPNKRGFWSFLYLAKHSKTISSSGAARLQTCPQDKDMMVVEEKECEASFDRKVSRSRSVGCGSRSFSGDLFERISTGFGDCTLRRVESQREGKSKVSGNDCIKERVRCGGLFSGFMITSSSSSSSSSSYWVGSNPNEGNGKGGGVQHSRSKSWGWALASPMRAFSKPSSNSKREKQNPSPNLGAIPSLLSVRS
ncbi:uncharacterized protein DDB_G0271670-like [Cynara cardunculus var. scolymus]|uniref:Uncharacterized protein n=1 Tax=Cynara cardunculus var. scolymus TaxID=59895 RepID=A0A103XJL5_CYNCS|nr:uncharacterized protein DDB_G0271670-like [Cynara cardunculus var. scolymus]KVH91985.1 hypothetical protein Ccrd_005980 [Cynara cardunculus var. scolymus]